MRVDRYPESSFKKVRFANYSIAWKWGTYNRDGTLSLFLKIKFQLNGHFSVKPKVLVFILYLNDKFSTIVHSFK